jgi:hypothetical protein
MNHVQKSQEIESVIGELPIMNRSNFLVVLCQENGHVKQREMTELMQLLWYYPLQIERTFDMMFLRVLSERGFLYSQERTNF